MHIYRGQSTTDQIFMPRQIIEKTYQFNVDVHHLIIDFKQAYNSINYQLEWNVV
jgi:hypothetical protein